MTSDDALTTICRLAGRGTSWEMHADTLRYALDQADTCLTEAELCLDPDKATRWREMAAEHLRNGLATPTPNAPKEPTR